jgi:hypothetical protein
MIGAPDIDQGFEAAPVLVQMVGQVAGEIGPRAVGFFQRPVAVVAEIAGPE